MIQIAIGDDTAGFTVLDGCAISAPFLQASVYFSADIGQNLREKVEMTLQGTPAQINGALAILELIIQRSIQYELGAYPLPQFLRFQQTADLTYLYTQIFDLHLEVHTKGYITRQIDSLVVTLHYTRHPYFEGAYQSLTLTDLSGSDHAGSLTLENTWDNASTYGNSFLVKPTAFTSDLPAPVRLQIKNTFATGSVLDLFVGVYHHPTETNHRPFYALYSDLTGGSALADPTAIDGSYRTITWTASAYMLLFTFALSAANTHRLDGRWYRPIVHLFSAHAYADLYLRLYITRGADVLEVGEPIYADANYQYLIFPPVQIPPAKLLRENLPYNIELKLYGYKLDGAAATLTVDQVFLQPLDPSLSFLGFSTMAQNDSLVYDPSLDLHNIRVGASGYETNGHVLRGDPLTIYPGEYNRLFFTLVNANHQIDIARTFTVYAYYRNRVRFV